MRKQEEFLELAESYAFNREHRERMSISATKYTTALAAGKAQFANLELARDRAAYIKWKVNENLDKYLIDFESNLMRKGGKVVWADTAETALNEVDAIMKRHQAQLVVKGKSSVAEEIGLNEHLRGKGIEVIETDLGEYVVDVAGEKPYHFVTPAKIGRASCRERV